ncbi:HU family DNA-binding protein [Roseivivax sp. GX 12232]|uniref:HU family DNA-binding protein n=1 Tax=Roseivivax sp. GX 12232 TaxID=2900547 RepID=UPI001E4FE591|nr:HU family DNA-binding protein [Roseivivax sp. GX 12232]MCE0504204.1 HU family DNA-binding protein [Roseivivax sp. GX 12232]
MSEQRSGDETWPAEGAGADGAGAGADGGDASARAGGEAAGAAMAPAPGHAVEAARGDGAESAPAGDADPAKSGLDGTPVASDGATSDAAAASPDDPEAELDLAVAATLDPSVLPPAQQPGLKKRELVDKIVRRTGVKKKEVKPVIEAALEILGGALSEGRELNLKPFGKMKVQRVKEVPNGQVLVTKVRQPEEVQKGGKDPLAQPAE